MPPKRAKEEVEQWPTLERLGFTVESPFLETEIPQDKQKDGSGSCFILAPIILRHLLQKKYPSVFAQGMLDEKTIEQLLKAHGNWDATKGLMEGGDPIAAMRDLVGNEHDVPIKHSAMSFITTEVETSVPVILPFLAPRHHRKPQTVDVIPAEEYFSLAVDIVKKTTKKQDWHSQVVVGTATKDGKKYWIAIQSWKEHHLTLYPMMTGEDFETLNKTTKALTSEKLVELQEYHRVLIPSLKVKPMEGIVDRALTLSAGPARYSSTAMVLPLKDFPHTK